MSLITEPINDKLFIELADTLAECADRKQKGCLRCRRLKECLKWWDKRVCQYCEFRLLKPEYLVMFKLEFGAIQQGANGNGRKLAKLRARWGQNDR